ncbi:butyrate kinase [Clostridium botulinum]|uniref:butyrate kinase n=1 Tax=Clostridium botulinum TaxID=1491 RepID=UPI000362AB6A|nr:butyrate kinase [Clostridium botulinum]MBN1034197.1 butyrate kinase [Clostridium botulinum]NFG57355.1 butyrate kinase [Clostridium botulinum]
MSYKLLIINPGSTSTKIGVYENEKELFEETLRHTNEEIKRYETIYDQFQFRKDVILNILKEKNFDITTLSAIVGRGGMLKPVEGGTYAVNDAMIEDLKVGVQGPHASNLGGIIAKSIGDELNIPSFIVDPVVTDELDEVARLSGVPELPRKSKFHALNQKAVAKRYGKDSGKGYENLNLIVVHMGGGVSVGAHKHGKVVDVNNALDGDGPFSPERAGTVPVGDLIKMCFSGQYTESEVYTKIVGKGGFVGYLNTNDVKGVIDKMEEGDKECEKIYKAFLYQITKTIGEMAAALNGKVDQILLTGGIAYSPTLVPDLKSNVEWIAPVTVYPGEDELLALAQGAIRVLDGEEKAKIY